MVGCILHGVGVCEWEKRDGYCVSVGIYAVSLYTFRFQGSSNDGVFYYAASILYSLQVWVSFVLSLTKPDVRENVVGLFTFQACKRQASNEDSKQEEEKPSVAEEEEKPPVAEEEEKPPVAEDQIAAGDDEGDFVNVFYFDGDDAPVPRKSEKRSSAISTKLRSFATSGQSDLTSDDGGGAEATSELPSTIGGEGEAATRELPSMLDIPVDVVNCESDNGSC